MDLLNLIVGAVVAAVLIGECVSFPRVDINNPVRTAEEDEVKRLPGSNQSMKFKFYAGYLKAFDDGEREQWLYYWFVERESNPASAPVVLWLHGGPGDSSLSGALNQTGPFVLEKINFTKSSRLILSKNEFSWNKAANILYIECPVGVGFSYSRPPIDVVNDHTSAKANYLAVKNFMQKFPQYSKNPLYLKGLSYGGVYVSTLGVLVDKDPELNLKGIAIENGLLDNDLQASSLVLFAYYHGLLGGKRRKEISRVCCHNRELSRSNCCFDELHKHEDCRALVDASYVYLNVELGSIDFNTIHPKSSIEEESSKLMLQKGLVAGPDIWQTNTRSRANISLKEAPFCYRPATADFKDHLKDVQMRRAIHIPIGFKGLPPTDSINYCMEYAFEPEGLRAQMKSLIMSKRNLTMLVFNGDTDLRCNFLGSLWFVEGLNRTIIGDHEPWEVNGKVAGFVQQFDGITFATVIGAGHEPSRHRPRATYNLFKKFLESEGSREVDLASRRSESEIGDRLDAR